MSRKKWPDPDTADPRGLECRKCGCHDLRVLNTTPTARGMIVRYRVCRHCGSKLTTYEVPPAGLDTTYGST